MRIWVFSQLNPELAIFNTFRAYKISGPLRLDLLTKCLDEIAARHEVLRTTYPEIDGIPRPVIAEKSNIRLEVSDSVDSLASGSEEEVTAYCNKRIGRPIELTSGPLFRAEVVKAAENEHILIMVSHQIIFDGASWSILNRELTSLYESYYSNSVFPLKDIPLQYVDFAAWQGEYLQAGVLDLLSSYWRQQLGDDLPALGLPVRGDAPSQTYNEGHSLPFSVPGKLTESLKQLGRQEGVTLFVVLLSAFSLLLRQFADQSDPVVFTSVPCRTRAEFRNVIGLFSNFIPLRTNLSGNPVFSEMLADVQKVYSGALGHQDLPFEYITKEFQSEQGGVNESLFQTLFVFENAAKKSLCFTQCKLIPLNLKSGFTKFDITLFLEEKEGGLTGSLRYKPAKFDPEMIELMVNRFITVLELAVAKPDQRIKDIRCLTSTERDILQKAKSSGGGGSIADDRKTAVTSRTSAQTAPGIPRTQMESRVAAVWEEVLGVNNIGTRDNFFDLGGNSLLLITLTGRLQKTLQRKISILEIFRDPTVSSFVKRLGDQDGGGSSYDHIHERAANRRASKNRRKDRARRE
jgi:acyl carrier protein